MNEVSHRQLRNDSAEVLRRVAAGETIVITNHGQPAAVIAPPPSDMLSFLTAVGQIRVAVDPTASLRSVVRAKSDVSSARIIDDVRGDW